MGQFSNEQLQTWIKNIQKEFGDGSGFCILHLDSNSERAKEFSAELAKLNVKVVSSTDPHEAIAILAEQKFDVVLVCADPDSIKPNGYDFKNELTKQFPLMGFCVVPTPMDFDNLVEELHSKALPKIRGIRDDRELKQCFVSDSEALIEESEGILLRLEQDASDADALNRFYAIMHTLKGASAFFEPKDMHKFVHAYEDILKKLQRGELKFHSGVSVALFKGFDVIKELFGEFKTGKHKSRDFEKLLLTLEISGEPMDETSLVESTDESLASAGLQLENGGGPVSGADKNHAPQGLSKPQGTDDIKVSVKLLDEFMQLSGEVTVIRNMLNKCVSSIERRFAGDRDVGMLTELLSELHKINSGVQNKMTEIRKVPLKSIVRMLPRAVRDVALSLNKKVDLKITGEELRVDTSVAEVLNNSLLHIIKNSLDHGIESASDRQNSGKPEVGQIIVEASTRDDKVIVKISDDGKGLNVEAIKGKLIKNGTHTRAQVDEMTVPELYAMIFSSGFSTAAQVTEISGRGVGMSMVKDSVDAIGGQILIESNPGKGATFTLELPVPKSVLIASCLGIRVGKRRFSLVQDDILRVLQFDEHTSEQNIKQLEQSEFLVFEGELLPIVNLNKLLKLSQDDVLSGDHRKLVVMKSGQDHRRMVIEVSEILDVEDMVIKTLHTTLNATSFYKGVTFMDDGGVGLILSTSGIMDALNISRERAKELKKHMELSRAENEAKMRTNLQHALTVRVERLGTYAFPQGFIHRIEEIDGTSIQQSGRSFVVPYRGSVLKVVRLAGVLSKTPKHENFSTEESARQRLVVLKDKNSMLGIQVDEVLDMVSFEDLKKDLVQPDLFIDGHFFLGENTVALLNPEGIFTKLTDSVGLDSPGVGPEGGENGNILPFPEAA